VKVLEKKAFLNLLLANNHNTASGELRQEVISHIVHLSHHPRQIYHKSYFASSREVLRTDLAQFLSHFKIHVPGLQLCGVHYHVLSLNLARNHQVILTVLVHIVYEQGNVLCWDLLQFLHS
jgi:hypothetical protein